jgi:hypothetical protein
MTKTLAAINDDTAFLTLLHDLLTDEGYQGIRCARSAKA